MSQHYIGYMHSGRREIFRSTQKPTRASHGHRYKSYRGPMPLVAAHYLKYREESGYPPLPPETSAAGLEAMAYRDQDTHWQNFLLELTAPDPEVEIQELEAAEYNPDLHGEASYPIFTHDEAHYG